MLSKFILTVIVLTIDSDVFVMRFDSFVNLLFMFCCSTYSVSDNVSTSCLNFFVTPKNLRFLKEMVCDS